MKTKTYNILLIGYDEHLCLSILYCLRKRKRFRLHLLTHNKKSVCKYSRFLGEIFYYDKYEDLPSAISDISKEINLDLIMPYDELESLYVSKNRKEIEKIAPVVPLTDPEIYERAINKNGLYRLLSQKGLEIMPKSIMLDEITDTKTIKQLSLPILIKPARGSYGRGIVSLTTEKQLDQFLIDNTENLSGFAAQEFIKGSDITCNIFAVNGEIQHYTIQESPVKGINNYAKNDDLTFQDDPEVLTAAKIIVAVLKWNGVACLDLRRSTETGKIYLLEINGRFWGSVSSSLDKANVNFPLIMIKQSLFGKKLQYKKKEGIQISGAQLLQDLKQIKFSSLKRTKYKSYLKDPIARFMKYYPK